MQERLNRLLDRLQREKSLRNRLIVLDEQPDVSAYFLAHSKIKSAINDLDEESQYVLKSVIAIGQGEMIFQKLEDFQSNAKQLQELIGILKEVEHFYQELGGVIGYHITMLQFLQDKNKDTPAKNGHTCYFKPEGMKISELSPQVRQMIRWGIKSLPQIGEIFPVGGAGDRLNLHHEITGKALPSAQLHFNGFTLLAGLIRDLQAREYLYYKLTGKQLLTPIAMMTSLEKENHQHVLSICESNHWFDRPKDSFRLFMQPLVPVLTIEGDWAVSEPLKLILKPGGHGVIWKLAQDAGVFQWLEELGRSKVLLRQINNPIAGIDYGLLAFVGVGCNENRKFGFASCDRLLNTSEGMNVLIESKEGDNYNYTITNIEYTDFKEKGIQDIPLDPKSKYSQFPANTNILFIDIQALQNGLKVSSLPGMLINMKTSISCLDREGHIRDIKAGRLETMMQNIADVFVDSYSRQLTKDETAQLSTYVTFNERRKTISVTKKHWDSNQPILETPEGCFFELLQNHEELLSKYCHMQLPVLGTEEDFIKSGPSFIFSYHPALGPIYEVIAQKINRGKLAKGSELRLEIAEIEIENLDLVGSLQVHAQDIMGHRIPGKGYLQYSDHGSKCILKNITVRNAGIDFSVTSNVYWRNQIKRHETLLIRLGEKAEFYADGVNFNKGLHIDVPDHHRAIAVQNGDEVEIHLERIKSPSWYWHYAFDEEDRIVLIKQEGKSALPKPQKGYAST